MESTTTNGDDHVEMMTMADDPTVTSRTTTATEIVSHESTITHDTPDHPTEETTTTDPNHPPMNDDTEEPKSKKQKIDKEEEEEKEALIVSHSTAAPIGTDVDHDEKARSERIMATDDPVTSRMIDTPRLPVAQPAAHPTIGTDLNDTLANTNISTDAASTSTTTKSSSSNRSMKNSDTTNAVTATTASTATTTNSSHDDPSTTTTTKVTSNPDAVTLQSTQPTETSHNRRHAATISSSTYDSLRWTVVTNDGTPKAWIKLIGLKSLFAKQLPKMPRSYIARLVMDVQHTSLVLLSDNPALADSDDEIIGSICYRPFQKERFAEIAFCAVHASHQVKGYGTKLMNLLKQLAVQQGIEYFITYADNYAIGYFKKQGFTKQITMPKGRYYGLIKDYDGGTPMECYVHPSIDYFRVPDLIQEQRNFILRRIANRSALSITTVYPPLTSEFIYHANHNNNPTTNNSNHPALNNNNDYPPHQSSLTNDIIAGATTGPSSVSVSRSTSSAARALTIPGVMEAGWTLADLIQATNKSDDMKLKSSVLKQELLGIVRKIDEQQFAWPFREPVTIDEAPDYYDVIRHPIDLKTIANRIRQDNHYKTKQMLYVDLMLMINNCKLYNDDGSTYIQCSVQLEKYIQTVLFHDTILAMSTAANVSSSSSSSSNNNNNQPLATTNLIGTTTHASPASATASTNPNSHHNNSISAPS